MVAYLQCEIFVNLRTFPFRLVLKIIFDGCSLFKGADSAFFLEGRDGSSNGDVMHSRLKEKAEDAHKSEDTRS